MTFRSAKQLTIFPKYLIVISIAFNPYPWYRRRMSSRSEIERLRARAAFYRREAAMADYRARFIYCQALAQHLEEEAAELERVLKSYTPKSPRKIISAV